jgi:long-chain acyl-CoA synthetase
LAKAKSDKTVKAAAEAAAPASDSIAAEPPKPRKPTRKKVAAPAAAPAGDASPVAETKSASAPAKAPDRPWLNSYPEGMPAEIGALPAPSVGELMANSCRQYANRPAFTCMGKSISFAELERQSSSLGGYLQSLGLEEGARIAIMLPNVLQSPVTMMAALRAGFTVVNVNPLYTPRELEYQLKDSGAEAIVILENFARNLEQAIAKTDVKHVIVAAMGDLLGIKGALVNFVVRRVKKMVPEWSLPGHVRFNDALTIGSGKTFRPARVGGDDLAFLQYTGGTTGVSKGAMLLHRNVLANVEQNALWVGDAYRVKPKPDNLTYLCVLPLYHIFALTINGLMGMHQGANNVMIPNPRDIPSLVKEMRRFPIHVFPGLNTLFNALLNNEAFAKLDFKPLVLTLAGGMAVQRAVAERWLKATACPITEGYGLSETSPVATANKFSSAEFTGTIGLPLPSTEIAICDDSGNDLPVGEVGEICIRGPQVMAGYWNRPDETAKVMTKDGFFTTGDIGRMDERGYVTIVDRKKDMILVSGFKVFPNEVEDVIARHPGVLEVAVVGVADEHSGEVPKLFVVKKDPALTAEDVAAFCKENLTGYKRPRYIEFRTELPKSNVGKILRRELRG